jgi:hypothetical protein
MTVAQPWKMPRLSQPSLEPLPQLLSELLDPIQWHH